MKQFDICARCMRKTNEWIRRKQDNNNNNKIYTKVLKHTNQVQQRKSTCQIICISLSSCSTNRLFTRHHGTIYHFTFTIHRAYKYWNSLFLHMNMRWISMKRCTNGKPFPFQVKWIFMEYTSTHTYTQPLYLTWKKTFSSTFSWLTKKNLFKNDDDDDGEWKSFSSVS